MLNERHSQSPFYRCSSTRKLALETLESRRLLAVDFELLKDVNQLPSPLGSSPTEIVEVGATTYFVAKTRAYGRELWKTDGTEAGTMLVKDIRPGALDSDLVALTNLNGSLYFRADDGVHGAELWKSDGTEAGTVLVREFRAGPEFGIGNELILSLIHI